MGKKIHTLSTICTTVTANMLLAVFAAMLSQSSIAQDTISAHSSQIPLSTLQQLWHEPTQEYKMKTWWFFGYERTTDEGITADAEALRDAGFGGVVYYDQNHAKEAGANGADDAFSPSWWHHLRFAASEAQRCGLSFEVNISNGYCAGGRWIDARHAMQRVAAAEMIVTVGDGGTVSIENGDLSISGPEGYVSDIATIALPMCDDGLMRHVTARYVARGKGRNGAMQRPEDRDANPLNSNLYTLNTNLPFSGYGFEQLPDIGMLQASDDSVSWRDVVTLEPMYRSQGGYFVRTTAFPATAGRYWRIRYNGTDTLRSWHVGSAPMTDRWEERAALQSDFADDEQTPDYKDKDGIVSLATIHYIDKTALRQLLHSEPCTLSSLPRGRWRLLRLAAVLTGAKSKHGRKNLLGYECDKLSAEAAELHWDSYVQPILDSIPSVTGVTMDSHEGGSQNWTPLMAEEFQKRRGYDLTPFLPVLAGYIVESVERTRQVLFDFRQTISDCIRDNYFGTFQRRATQNGVTFTAQAIGNALCITGDAVSVKQAVEKPQGEFWTYQRDGAYDIKDCSSAAHLYGKPIASAEAMTDCEYKDSPDDLRRVSNIAFAMGAQEFVVCATPHIPYPTASAPYIAGREYAINRSNPRWQQMKEVWQQNARSMVLLRQGKAAPDVLVFLGDDVPIKTLTSRLPAGLDDLDWDVCTADALRHRLKPVDGRLCTPDGISYKALLIGRQAHMTEPTRRLVGSLRSAGVPVLHSGKTIARPLMFSRGQASVVHTHRQTSEHDIFFIASIEDHPVSVTVRLKNRPQRINVWYNRTGECTEMEADGDDTFTLKLLPMESVFVSYRVQ